MLGFRASIWGLFGAHMGLHMVYTGFIQDLPRVRVGSMKDWKGSRILRGRIQATIRHFREAEPKTMQTYKESNSVLFRLTDETGGLLANRPKKKKE